jgi:type I restriction enzyme M protein
MKWGDFMLGAIIGGIAEAYYGIPSELRNKAMTYLDERLTNILTEFEKEYPPRII